MAPVESVAPVAPAGPGDEHAPLREAAPDAINAVSIDSIKIPSCLSFNSSPFEYLKVMESWMVVARHLQDDATETARLQLRFQEVYLLVEVGVRRDMSLENAIKKMEEDEAEGKDATDQAMDKVAYALVSLVDEAALLDLFNSQSTSLQFVELRGNTRCLPPEGGSFCAGFRLGQCGEARSEAWRAYLFLVFAPQRW